MKLPDGTIKLRHICKKCGMFEECEESAPQRTMCKSFIHRQKFLYLYVNMTDQQIEAVYGIFGSAEEAIKELHDDVHEIAAGEGYPDHMVFQAGIEDIERRIYKLYEHE